MSRELRSSYGNYTTVLIQVGVQLLRNVVELRDNLGVFEFGDARD